MSERAASGARKRSLRIRGTRYPVILPTLRDARLHLAAVIVSLQVLGQVAFDFRLSIAQILISLLTCAVLEVGIAAWRQKVILWPASALLTGNGVAFILRVPGTEHGDWWSMRGWWIFAGAAAVSLLSKHLIQIRGRHIFNPSNFGLVLCFLALGPERADPLEFWWGPMSAWLAVALAIIVAGGFAILRRLHLLAIALTFWVTFAASLAVVAASGHSMTTRWHVGPVTDWSFWRILTFSPEILVFLFFMITDPKTIPSGRVGRRVYAVALGLLAALLVAPQSNEFRSKVAVLAALAIVCLAAPLVELVVARRARAFPRQSRRAVGVTGLAAAVASAGLLVLAGIPARPDAGAEAAASPAASVEVVVVPAKGIAPLGTATARRIAADVVADLEIEADALRRRDLERATEGARGSRLAGVWRQIQAASGGAVAVPRYRLERVTVTLEPGSGQTPPTVVARLAGTVATETYGASASKPESRTAPKRFTRTLELALEGGRYLIAHDRDAAAPGGAPTRSNALAGIRLRDVAHEAGLDFRHGAFRFGVSNDPAAMMGGGLCWLDYDNDGRLDLFVTNAFSDDDYSRWEERGGLPRAALFHNVGGGRFEDVSRGSGADLALRGSGCVAADLDGDGNTDLYVTTTGYSVATDGYDALLWGHGDGTFTEGARAAGINTPGWHTGAAVGDVNGDGRPDLFVAGYTDMNAPIASSAESFPSDHAAVRDRLYLSDGQGADGRTRFREVGRLAGLEPTALDHGLGAVFTDVDLDGRLDLYVANDLDPNRLYLNEKRSGGLGFRLRERGRSEGVADPNAGMGIAAGDFSLDGREDLFVSNSRRQLHAIYRSTDTGFADARPDFSAALGKSYTGWGVTWADLDLDGDLDLALANGAIPITRLAHDAQLVQVIENRSRQGIASAFEDAGSPDGLRLNGRGLAAADYDDDGDVDLAINSIGGRLVLLQNTGATGHWLEVALDGFAPGARVAVTLPDGRRLVREAHAGSSYLSSEDPRLHFGLGDATRIRELVVDYPDGRATRLTNVAVDRRVAVTP